MLISFTSGRLFMVKLFSTLDLCFGFFFCTNHRPNIFSTCCVLKLFFFFNQSSCLFPLSSFYVRSFHCFFLTVFVLLDVDDHAPYVNLPVLENADRVLIVNVSGLLPSQMLLLTHSFTVLHTQWLIFIPWFILVFLLLFSFLLSLILIFFLIHVLICHTTYSPNLRCFCCYLTYVL